MKLTTFSVIWAVIYISFGLGLFFIPGPFLAPFGLVLSSSGAFVARLLGAALTAFSIIYWGNRKQPASDRVQSVILLGSLIYNLMDVPVVLIAVLHGVTNSMGWVPVGLHTFLAVTFGYFVFKRE